MQALPSKDPWSLPPPLLAAGMNRVVMADSLARRLSGADATGRHFLVQIPPAGVA